MAAIGGWWVYRHSLRHKIAGTVDSRLGGFISSLSCYPSENEPSSGSSEWSSYHG